MIIIVDELDEIIDIIRKEFLVILLEEKLEMEDF